MEDTSENLIKMLLSGMDRERRNDLLPFFFQTRGGFLQQFGIALDPSTDKMSHLLEPDSKILDAFEATRGVITLMNPDTRYPSVSALVRMQDLPLDTFNENEMALLDRAGRRYLEEMAIIDLRYNN